ncbi:MAG: hypothetical protein OEM97_08985 [Acidimicrobiia bacterium]|nr:hypothetical protein [Acidimicrobiia bacterium]
MTEALQQVSSGTFELPLAAVEAIWMFTPEGERAWAAGWDPTYPTGRASEAAGTVFATSANGVQTTWVIIDIDRPHARASYARVTPGHHAGTVRVECIDTRPGHCDVTVQYALTAIDGAGPHVLEPHGPERFEEMMEAWAAAIEWYLTRHAAP